MLPFCVSSQKDEAEERGVRMKNYIVSLGLGRLCVQFHIFYSS